MANAKKLPRFVTPKGVLKYPWLNKADYKYKDEGEYRVTVLIPEAAVDAPIRHKLEEYNGKTLRQILDAIADESFEKAQADAKPADKKKITRADSCPAEVDDQGEETGNIELKIKMKAHVAPKGKEAWDQKPDLLDAHRKPVTVPVFGGSIGKVVFEALPYFVASSKTAGVTLRLRAVQIIELAQRGGNYDDLLDDEDGFTGDDDGVADDLGDDDESVGEAAPTGEGW